MTKASSENARRECCVVNVESEDSLRTAVLCLGALPDEAAPNGRILRLVPLPVSFAAATIALWQILC
jgi:hypothetical protein